MTQSPSLIFRGNLLRSPLVLLTGQSFFFGLTLSLIIIPASAIFLDAFGAGLLPYTYITSAFLGSLVSVWLGVLQRRLTLARLTINTVLAVTALFFLSWIALVWVDARWVSFLLWVSFSLFIQIGFVLIGGQAGRLFDVKQIKNLFPRIVSGFAIGFMVGGFIAPPLVVWFRRTENLLLATSAASLAMLALVVLTNHHFHARLNQLTDKSPSQQPRPKLSTLLRKRYVVLIFTYQMFSAMGSQLLDFLLFAQAAIRFTSSEEIATFFGHYTAVLNLVDILFLALAAGWLISRFGLRFGLSANPAVVLLLIGTILAVGLLLGPGSFPFFILIAAARVIDIALTDGTTRTSLNAAYQALPPLERLAVQTGVEGIGVPVALGLTGVILIVFEALPGLTTLHLVGLTLLVTICWTTAGFLVYRDYGANLILAVKRRYFAPDELEIADPQSLAALAEMAHSDSPANVRLALDLIETADPGSLEDHLGRILANGRIPLQRDALGRIAARRLAGLRPAVLDQMAPDRDPSIRAAACLALAAIDEERCVPLLVPLLDEVSAEIAHGAAAGLLRHGGIAGILAAGQRLMNRATSPDPTDRRWAAGVVGAVGSPQLIDPLFPLLQDEDSGVRRAALQAAGRAAHPRLLPLVLANLSQPGLRSTAAEAVARFGEHLLPPLTRALAGQEALGQVQLIRLLRLCRRLPGPAVIAALQPFLDHSNREIQHHILVALSLAGYFPTDPEDIQLVRRLLQRNLTQTTALLAAVRDLTPLEEAPMIQRALQAELHLLQRHRFGLLSFLYDPEAVRRAEKRIALADERSRALALEMLEVTLKAADKQAVLPLLTPGLSPADRLKALPGSQAIPPRSPDQRLSELMADSLDCWTRLWIQTCAVYEAGRLGQVACRAAVEPLQDHPDPVLRETARWALNRLAL